MAPQCLPGREKPGWITKARRVLIQNYKSKGNEVSN